MMDSFIEKNSYQSWIDKIIITQLPKWTTDTRGINGIY